MNNDEENEELIIVEPSISYHSSLSTNFGVASISSNNNHKSNKRLNILFCPSSARTSFSLHNTIMLPLIINTEEHKVSKDINNKSVMLPNNQNQEADKFLLSRNKTFCSKEDLQESKKSRMKAMKGNNNSVEINPFYIGKENKDKSIETEKLNNNSQSNNESNNYLNRKQSKSLYYHSKNIKHRQ